MTAPSDRPDDDIYTWLEETYDEIGQDIWLTAWSNADPQRRAHLERLARTPEMGT